MERGSDAARIVTMQKFRAGMGVKTVSLDERKKIMAAFHANIQRIYAQNIPPAMPYRPTAETLIQCKFPLIIIIILSY